MATGDFDSQTSYSSFISIERFNIVLECIYFIPFYSLISLFHYPVCG